MKTLALVLFVFFANAAHAADFKCYASKYPKDLQHAFTDGYTTLSINGPKATLSTTT